MGARASSSALLLWVVCGFKEGAQAKGYPPRQAIDAECLCDVGVCVCIYKEREGKANGGDQWDEAQQTSYFRYCAQSNFRWARENGTRGLSPLAASKEGTVQLNLVTVSLCV